MMRKAEIGLTEDGRQFYVKLYALEGGVWLFQASAYDVSYAKVEERVRRWLNP